ncbi:Leucine-rich repeat domain, L domain-like [Phytophthora cactorum]|nr:Leucine-rich repeat domain, L domain-like [Phytophthora cactorum]
MDPAEYSRSNQNDLVSSLDLLEEEVLREASKHGPQWNRDKHLLVEGEPAVTGIVENIPRKPNLMSKASTRRRYSKSRGRDRSANNAEEEEASRRQLQLENERLHHEIAHWQREVAHARDEKLELEASFRRLDQEIGSGYHLAERKEKELRIAELVTKNQKMSQLLEKELQSQEEQRRAHTELQGELRKLTEHVTLLNQVLDTVETKHTELSSSHNTLLASYEAAQNTIETLQNEIHVLQDKLATSDIHVQLVTEYENKIQQWERICRELEQKCEHKTQKLKQTQKIATATQQEAQRALDRQEELEQEVRNAHDQVIQTNAAMRTMEAKLEANLKTGGSQESLLCRIRQLEGELQQMNRANAELMQTFNQLLSSQRRPGSGKDQLAAAVESNDIIQSALEQMQDPPKADHVNMSGSMYLHLARDKYLLEAPYPLELLADQTGAQVLSGHPESTTRAKTKKFSPFRVTCSALKPKDNQQDESEDQMDQLVTLSAVSNDTSGASYLNRSKINAFLEKFKTLVIGKLAECLHKLRELAHRSASEAATQQASIQMLQREVIELQYRLKNYHNDDKNDQARGSMAAKGSYKTRQFLLKMVDVYAEKQHENDHRQMTFVTQPLSSDMLITKTHNENYSSSDDRLLLPESQLKDDEVGQLLLKILVSGVSFREINLDSNNLSDVGAQHVADFLEKSLTSVRVLSLVGNKRITRRGIELIKGGLLRNQRVQRVSEDEREVEDRIILRGLAIGRDFDVSGNATEVLRVILPIVSKNEEIGAALTTATPEAVDAMTEKLRQLGFRYNIRPASASSRPRSAPYNTKKRIELHPRSTSADATTFKLLKLRALGLVMGGNLEAEETRAYRYRSLAEH